MKKVIFEILVKGFKIIQERDYGHLNFQLASYSEEHYFLIRQGEEVYEVRVTRRGKTG